MNTPNPISAKKLQAARDVLAAHELWEMQQKRAQRAAHPVIVDQTMPECFGATVVTLDRWLKRVGDTVVADDVLFDISADWFSAEAPAITHGIIRTIEVEAGETVGAGTIVCTIEEIDAIL